MDGCYYVCHEVENSKLHVTWYYRPVESEFHSGRTVAVKGGKEILSLDEEAVIGASGMRVQGSLKVGDRWINSLIVNADNTYSASWGFGNPQLIELKTGAVGPHSSGIYYYLPAFKKTINEGIIHGVDRGGAIVDGDLDIYVGVGKYEIGIAMKQFDKSNLSQPMMESGVFGEAGNSNFSYSVCEKTNIPTTWPKDN